VLEVCLRTIPVDFNAGQVIIFYRTEVLIEVHVIDVIACQVLWVNDVVHLSKGSAY
jgi:hypothetical protein